MDISLFFCEFAHTSADGKLELRGIYNELYASGFPARQDRLVLAGIVEWDRTDDGDHPFQIDLLDPTNAAIFTVDGHSQVDARPASRPPAKTHLILPLENLIFPQAGEFPIRITVKGEKIAGPSLYVMQS